MKLITSEEILRRYIPNVLASVKGEVPLIDKLTSFLDIAEEWVAHTFTSESTFSTIAGYADANIIKTYAAKVVVCEAFKNAVPSLDKKISDLIAKYRAESIDIDDIEFEEPDVMDWAEFQEINENETDS